MLVICEGRRGMMNINKKLVLLLGIILMIFIIGIMTIIASVPSKHRKIEISTAQRKNLTQILNVEGVVEPNKKQVISMDPSQKVIEVIADEGTDIKKGDLILKLDNSDNQYRLSIEEINLKLAERELSKVLNNEQSDKKDVEYSYKQAEIEFHEARSELEIAQNMAAADKILYEKGAISKSQYEDSVKNIKSKENILTLKTMELDRAALSLANFDLGRDEQIFKLRSDISLIKENMDNLKSKVDAETRADMDGRVVKLDVDKEILIYDMSRHIVNIQLKQQDSLYVKEGMKAEIKVKGLDEKKYKGTVTDIDEIALTSNGGGGSKINVQIVIDNPDEDIKIGYDVEVKLDISIKPEAVVVDFESIIQDNDGKKYIYYVENDIARRRIVSTGIETSFEVEITEGIIHGDRYVVNPPPEMQEKNTMKIWGWRYESK
jgi:HlyD family secretion protein